MKPKTLLLLSLCLFAGINAYANAVEIDGIYFNLISKLKTAEVTSNPDKNTKYTGAVNIPETVIYNGTEYSVTSIGEGAFSSCGDLTTVTIPNSITSINDWAFSSCGLTSVTIPNSVTKIGSLSFCFCYSLTSVIIGNGVTSIDVQAFYYCASLTSITIPNSVKQIGEEAFRGCSSLTSAIISNSMTKISQGVFAGCSNLTSVTIPNSIISIGTMAFLCCSSLTSVDIPNSVTNIGDEVFEECTSLTSITIPNSVTSIGAGAFSGCKSLISVTIPSSVTNIFNDTFAGCSNLTLITIGSGVNRIYSCAFADCPELTDVYCYVENVPSTDSDAFKGSYIKYATLHVPTSALGKYKTTAPWKSFGTIVSINNDSEPPTPKCAIPTISYANGKLTFKCETEGVEFVSSIADTDVKQHYEASISLSATYHISVYATKTGYDNSEEATATLCWIDVEPQTEGITDEDAVAGVKALPVLIQTQDGTITVQGAAKGTNVSVFSVNGILQDSAIADEGIVILNTALQLGSVAVVKIGEKTVKVAIK